MKFSVLMSIYYKELPSNLVQCFDSILEQSKLPDEIVIVKDGYLTKELDNVIRDFMNKSSVDIRVVALKDNVGLGLALNKGLLECTHNLVARVDSDDINKKDRFEKQIEKFESNENLVLLGGQIEEFIITNQRLQIVGRRNVPIGKDKINKFSKLRNPFNHMTVMFKKDIILDVGSYKHKPGYEDYDLWMRLLKKDYHTENLERVLVIARTGLAMSNRRGGIKYAKTLFKMRKDFFEAGYISFWDLLIGTSASSIVALVPSRIRNKVYTQILHK